jgi:hypothetical protein
MLQNIIIFFNRAIIKQGMAKLINLGEKALPYSLLSQFIGSADLNATQVIEWKINRVLNTGWHAIRIEACDISDALY